MRFVGTSESMEFMGMDDMDGNTACWEWSFLERDIEGKAAVDSGE